MDRNMDTEKAMQEDSSFLVQPKWTLYPGAQPRNLSKYRIFQSVSIILLLGLLTWNTSHFILGTSVSNAGTSSTHGFTVNDKYDLHGEHSDSPAKDDDGTWFLLAYLPESCVPESCHGPFEMHQGSGPQNCSPLLSTGGPAISIFMPVLYEGLSFLLYTDSACTGNPVPYNQEAACLSKPLSYYAVNATQLDS